MTLLPYQCGVSSLGCLMIYDFWRCLFEIMVLPCQFHQSASATLQYPPYFVAQRKFSSFSLGVCVWVGVIVGVHVQWYMKTLKVNYFEENLYQFSVITHTHASMYIRVHNETTIQIQIEIFIYKNHVNHFSIILIYLGNYELVY